MSSQRRQFDRRLAVIIAALVASVIGIAAGFALAVHVDDTSQVVGPVAQPSTKGVVSGTLMIASGPRPLTPVAGQVDFTNVAQIGVGWTPDVVPTAADGSFSVTLSPGIYQVGGMTEGGGLRRCTPGRTVRVRAGDHVSVNVQCQTGWP